MGTGVDKMLQERTGHLSKGLTAAAIILALAVSGCAQTQHSSGRPFTPEEQRLRQQASVYNQTVLEGCAVGIGVGALAGYLAGGNLTSTAVGAGAGAAIGCGAGWYIANLQEGHAGKEQQLDAMITDVRADNERMAGLVVSARQVIAKDKAKIDQIDRDLASGKMSMEMARAEMASVDDNQRYLESTLANVRLRQNDWKEVAKEARKEGDPAKVAEIDREMKKLETQISSLESELDTLVQRRTVSRVG
jgi:outer membrane lipoprotein SlyB